MTAYLALATLPDYSTMPDEMIDDLEASRPGWLDVQCEYWSAMINARLGKRYGTPFASPYPIAVRGWLGRIVTYRAYLKRGVDPTDPQMIDVKEDFTSAWTEIKEASEAENGLFDLPLRSDTDASGISKGGTRAYSERGPYVGNDVQAGIARDEDRNGGGTYT
jgi:hypothetical protein